MISLGPEFLGYRKAMRIQKIFIQLPLTNPGKNRITHFKDNLGNWINDPTQILEHALHFFQNAFNIEHSSTNLLSIRNNPQSFTNIDLSTLDNQLSPNEVVKAIFSFKPFKSPGVMTQKIITCFESKFSILRP